jgi:hypothetical protein
VRVCRHAARLACFVAEEPAQLIRIERKNSAASQFWAARSMVDSVRWPFIGKTKNNATR